MQRPEFPPGVAAVEITLLDMATGPMDGVLERHVCTDLDTATVLLRNMISQVSRTWHHIEIEFVGREQT